MVWESSRGWTCISAALVIIQGILPLVSLYLVKLIVDVAKDGLTAAEKGAITEKVILLVMVACGIAILQALIESVSMLVNEHQGQAVTEHMQKLLQTKAIEVDLEYYENSDYHDTLHRAQQDAPVRPTRLLRNLVTLAQNLISVSAIAALLASLYWPMAVILCVAAVPGVLVKIKQVRETYEWQRKRTLTERATAYYNLLLTVQAFAKEVRLFGLGPLFIQRSQELRKKLRSERMQLTQRRAFREFSTQSLSVLPVFAAFGFIASQTVQGALSLGALVMYYQAFQRGQSNLHAIFTSIVNLYEDHLFLHNVCEFLDLERKVAQPVEPKPVPQRLESGITFDRVSFRYPVSDRWALKDVSLTIRPGEVIALVGENGSGKSTLVKLLCRLYDPTDGRIMLDGMNLQQYEIEALRREISVVFQDYVHYHLTARENIWFGNVDLPPTDERIFEAAQEAGADRAIQGLRRGYETPLGKWLENGEELSVGEWQKIALARAFLRDAQIVILDEPTSSMDPRAEYEVFERFRQLVRGRTAILVSHRLSTVKMADHIYVMSDGEIVESGTHDELMRRGDLYANLFERQAEAYR